MQLGTNGTINPDDFDRMMQILKNTKRVVIINAKVPRPWEEEVNQVLGDGVKQYKNSVLVDWHDAAGDHPEWFYDDGLHLRPDGARPTPSSSPPRCCRAPSLRSRHVDHRDPRALYTSEPEALREVLRDVFGWDTSKPTGWLIFKLPPAELGVHPVGRAAPMHELSFMCDDLDDDAECAAGRVRASPDGVRITVSAPRRRRGSATNYDPPPTPPQNKEHHGARPAVDRGVQPAHPPPRRRPRRLRALARAQARRARRGRGLPVRLPPAFRGHRAVPRSATPSVPASRRS